MVASTTGMPPEGREALGRFGFRVAAAYLGSAAFALPLLVARDGWLWRRALLAGLVSCCGLLGAGLLVPATTPGGRRLIVLVAGVLAAMALLVALLLLQANKGDERAYELAGWVVAGAVGALAAGQGLLAGTASFATAVGVATIAGQALGHPAPVLTVLIGPMTVLLAGILSNVATRRALGATREALDSVELTEARRTVAERRWVASRAADRDLHDTVLATLTLIAHQPGGANADQVRARCRHDLAALLADAPAAAPSDDPPGKHTSRPESSRLIAVLETTLERARTGGLEIDLLHVEGPDDVAPHPPESAYTALAMATQECLENVRRHAGTSRCRVQIGTTVEDVVVVVADVGRGFDPDSVPADRLGLRASVVRRLQDVGGGATVLSQPQRGTTVVMRAPR